MTVMTNTGAPCEVEVVSTAQGPDKVLFFLHWQATTTWCHLCGRAPDHDGRPTCACIGPQRSSQAFLGRVGDYVREVNG
jgi:hypothetical protein